MELQTISQVTRTYDISARMLRYYEQIGLIKSRRNENNAYRAYDAEALRRIQQIIILRKLQIPVKQIYAMLENPETAAVIEVFKENIRRLEKEISALSTIQTILKDFVTAVARTADVRLNLDLLNEDSVQRLAQSLSLTQKNVKERFDMGELTKAAQVLNRLKNVRVVYLPPMTVASVYCTGEGCEERAWQAITAFVREKGLVALKPDLRLFRIEYANAVGENFGYAFWVSIPGDMEPSPPFEKKLFHGGQYAAYALGDGAFETVLGLQDWINESDRYRMDYEGNLARCEPPVNEIDSFGGMRLDLEEVLNFNNYREPGFEKQIDYLMPVKSYAPLADTPAELPGSREKCGYRAQIVTKNKFRIMGFTKVVGEGDDWGAFKREISADGRLDVLQKYRKPGAPILEFASIDMDSQIRGGARSSFCLMESDVTDAGAFMGEDLYVRTIDAAKWLLFTYPRGEAFDGHGACMQLGYTWNGVISGSFTVYPDGALNQPSPRSGADDVLYHWYPVK